MQGPRKLSRTKRILFRIALVAMIYGLTELSLLAYLNYSFLPLLEDRHVIATGDAEPRIGSTYTMMLHPYIGAVYQPDEVSEPEAPGTFHVTEHGFFDDRSPLRKCAPDKVIVGLIGGSVAREMGQSATGTLERELSQISEFRGRSFDFVHLAIDGQKQPQHLMALNYLLTIGAEFDVLINLDGVNEVSLPGLDNVPRGVSVAFPRKWGILTANVARVDLMRSIGHLTYLRTARRDCARWFDTLPLRYSPLGVLAWKARNVYWEKAIRKQMDEVALRSAEESHSYLHTGPREHFDSEEQRMAYCADLWARSSILLNGVCQARQVRYFHFLQPNQYVADSKPMGPAEAQVALKDSSPFARPVKIGYPLLQARASQLTEAGVVFTDLTRVFAEHPEKLYRDDCCHFTDAGNEIMAAAIGARIRTWYENQSTERVSPTQ